MSVLAASINPSLNKQYDADNGEESARDLARRHSG